MKKAQNEVPRVCLVCLTYIPSGLSGGMYPPLPGGKTCKFAGKAAREIKQHAKKLDFDKDIQQKIHSFFNFP